MKQEIDHDSNEIVFEVMIMYSEVLEKAIAQHNTHHKTDFKIIEIKDDEVIFCTISASRYTIADVFNLGHRLSVIEHLMRDAGELQW